MERHPLRCQCLCLCILLLLALPLGANSQIPSSSASAAAATTGVTSSSTISSSSKKTSHKDDSGASSSSSTTSTTTTSSSSKTKIDDLTWVYTSPSDWYTQHDLCILKNWQKQSANTTLPKVAKDKCHEDVLENEWAGRLSIGYGHSYTATCSPPLTDRPQYMQAMVGFNDPASMHLVDAMRDLKLLNRTLVFFGDSVMRQNYIGLLAELKRLDKHIAINRWASRKLMANKTTIPGVVNVFQDEKVRGDAALILTLTSLYSPRSEL